VATQRAGTARRVAREAARRHRMAAAAPAQTMHAAAMPPAHAQAVPAAVAPAHAQAVATTVATAHAQAMPPAMPATAMRGVTAAVASAAMAAATAVAAATLRVRPGCAGKRGCGRKHNGRGECADPRHVPAPSCPASKARERIAAASDT